MQQTSNKPADESKRAIVFAVRDLPLEVFGGEHGRQTRKFVLLTMATHANSDGTRCYPSVPTVARECGLTPRGAQKVVAWLRDNGFLQVSYKAGPNQSNLFTIVIPEVVNAGVRGEHYSSPRTETPEVVNAGVRGGGERSFDGGEPQRSYNLPETSQLPTNLRESDARDVLFDRFWETYPRKKAKRAALKAWRAALKRVGGKADAAAERIISGLQRQLQEFSRREADKIPYPATFLNSDAFDDVLDARPVAKQPANVSSERMDDRVAKWRASHQVPDDRTFHAEWTRVRREKLLEAIDHDTFEQWFKPVWAGGLDQSNRLHLLCPAPSHAAVVEQHLPTILDAARALNYEVSKVLVEVA